MRLINKPFLRKKSFTKRTIKIKMANCKHKCCGVAEKVWLPYEYEGRSRGLKAQSYCILCGVVKNTSGYKAKPMGYYTNILAKMPMITKVQIRLIVKELENRDFDDTYSMTRTEQEKLFSSVVKKYYKVSDLTEREGIVKEHFYS